MVEGKRIHEATATPLGRKPARILVVDDDSTLNRFLTAHLKLAGHSVTSASRWSQAEIALAQSEPDLVLLDLKLPDADGLEKLPTLSETCPVIILTAFATIDHAVEAIRRGAVDFLTKPVNPNAFDLAISRALSASEMKREYELYKRQAKSAADMTLLGRSPQMAQLKRMINVVGPADTTVLVLGESGVGKELVAAAVHEASPRADKPFVEIDCATLQAALFESELFGHEAGAFPGVERRKEGLIESAEGGTVLLDEIGELTSQLQAKLLRVLETGRYRRVGGTRDLVANVRFVASTHRDLKTLVERGDFRADLYYRLTGFTLEAPPLRDRVEDIPLLAEHFLSRRHFARHATKAFSANAIDALMRCAWPGNVRELRNVVERAALMSGDSPTIKPSHLGELAGGVSTKREVVFAFDHPPTLDEITEVYLDRLLADKTLSRTDIAKTLGVSERNLYRLINARKSAQDGVS
ncbi:MAG: sigma-54-dependent Fis family transcriptional regulator [Rhodoblastus sp.]|nr:MAG: sigma-54-dependent Fis family transcriptional regulator [Rhodoblastus sp.]